MGDAETGWEDIHMRALMPPALTTTIVRRSIGRSLRTGLASINVAGAPPTGGAVIAANHQSWWDGYVLGSLSVRTGHEPVIVMTSRQLSRFPFLRTVGAVSAAELREASRRTRAGAHSVIFPEGTLGHGASIGPLHGGAAWLAHTSGTPLIPTAVRVTLRGEPLPEAFVRYGAPVSPGDDLAAAIQATLDALEADLSACDPEAQVPGYRTVLRGQAPRRDAVTASVRLLAAMSGTPSRESD